MPGGDGGLNKEGFFRSKTRCKTMAGCAQPAFITGEMACVCLDDAPGATIADAALRGISLHGPQWLAEWESTAPDNGTAVFFAGRDGPDTHWPFSAISMAL